MSNVRDTLAVTGAATILAEVRKLRPDGVVQLSEEQVMGILVIAFKQGWNAAIEVAKRLEADF